MMPATEPRFLVDEAVEKLLSMLNSVPFLKAKIAAHGTGPAEEGELFPVDGILSVFKEGQESYLILEVKKNARLRQSRYDIERLLRFQAALENSYPVFISPYISKSIRKLCVEKEIGYMDFSGNCRLVFDNVYIEKEVPISVTPEKKRFRSLFSPKSCRVIRRLLEDPAKPWQVQTLAESAKVSLATVSQLKKKLLEDEYAERFGEFSIIISKPEDLLNDWSRNYNFSKHHMYEFYMKGSPEEVEKVFSSYCKKKKVQYAFTMFSGARRVASFTRGVERSHAYLAPESSIDSVAGDLNLKPVQSGGNIFLARPEDDDILFGKQKVDGAFVVSDIQLYLDLVNHRGRGEENAQYLLENRLRTKWQSDSK